MKGKSPKSLSKDDHNRHCAGFLLIFRCRRFSQFLVFCALVTTYVIHGRLPRAPSSSSVRATEAGPGPSTFAHPPLFPFLHFPGGLLAAGLRPAHVCSDVLADTSSSRQCEAKTGPSVTSFLQADVPAFPPLPPHRLWARHIS